MGAPFPRIEHSPLCVRSVLAVGLLAFIANGISLSDLRTQPALLSAHGASGTEGLDLEGCQGYSCLQRVASDQDSAFEWHEKKSARSGHSFGADWTSYKLHLTSQSWMPKATGQSGWNHDMEVVFPQSLTAQSPGAGLAVLLINEDRALAQEFAARTGIIAVSLSHTPPSFMRLGGASGRLLFEEPVKALSWAHFVDEPNQPWPIELPTMKAVIRAMDAVTNFSSQLHDRDDGVIPATSFVLAGWSKRAIAALMAAEVDPRVRAVIPISHPVDLNTVGRDSFRNIGTTVDAAKVYDQAGVSQATGAAFARLDSIIDPVHYLDRLTMPKFFMLAGCDDFFPPDSTRSWWGKLPLPASFYLFGNSKHAGFIEPFKDAAVSFITTVVLKKAMPAINWTINDQTGVISVHLVSEHTPLRISTWSAVTPEFGKRDFRRAEYHANETAVQTTGLGGWTAQADVPEDGFWTAFFVEFVFPAAAPGLPDIHLTTEASVVPVQRPFIAPPDRNFVF